VIKDRSPALDPDARLPPRASERRVDAALPLRQRAAVALVVVVVHALALGWMSRPGELAAPPPAIDQAIHVILLSPPASVPAADPGPPPPRRTARPPAPGPAVESGAILRREQAAAPDVTPQPPTPARIRLFRDDGSVALPDAVIDDLDAVTRDDRRFDYQVPGRAEAERFLVQRPALVYESTRFDEAWEPTQDILTAGLQKALEKSTVNISIPLPRAPGTRLVCKVTLLGGGCGFRSEDDGYVVQLDDPDTLDPDEDRQCRAWWDELTAAGSQKQWLELRRRYDERCRKPLTEAAQAARD
jgi:hypothetical protein